MDEKKLFKLWYICFDEDLTRNVTIQNSELKTFNDKIITYLMYNYNLVSHLYINYISMEDTNDFLPLLSRLKNNLKVLAVITIKGTDDIILNDVIKSNCQLEKVFLLRSCECHCCQFYCDCLEDKMILCYLRRKHKHFLKNLETENILNFLKSHVDSLKSLDLTYWLKRNLNPEEINRIFEQISRMKWLKELQIELLDLIDFNNEDRFHRLKLLNNFNVEILKITNENDSLIMPNVLNQHKHSLTISDLKRISDMMPNIKIHFLWGLEHTLPNHKCNYYSNFTSNSFDNIEKIHFKFEYLNLDDGWIYENDWKNLK